MFTKDAKYVIFDDGANYFPVIFPNHIQHNNMAAMLSPWVLERAGFVSIDQDGSLTAHGESISLRLKSRPEIDNKLLAKLFDK